MRKFAFLFLILAFLASSDACKSNSGPENNANVVMTEGPTLDEGTTSFWYRGKVQNKGSATANFTRVIIYIHDSSSSLLTQGEGQIDEAALKPNATSAWGVQFPDPNRALRNSMNKDKTTYEIKWE